MFTDSLYSMLPCGFRVMGCILLSGELVYSFDDVVDGLVKSTLRVVEDKWSTLQYQPTSACMGVWDGSELKLADAQSKKHLEIMVKEGGITGVTMKYVVDSFYSCQWLLIPIQTYLPSVASQTASY